MLNKITLHGYLGRDPELKEYTNSKGEKGYLVNFPLAVQRDSGEGTDWFDCTAFGRRAEVIEKWFRKGSQIVVTGRMQSTVSEKDGNKRKFWNVLVENFDFCDSKDSPRGVASVSDIPDSFEQAEEDNPFE